MVINIALVKLNCGEEGPKTWVISLANDYSESNGLISLILAYKACYPCSG